jgi:hypothetical protein
MPVPSNIPIQAQIIYRIKLRQIDFESIRSILIDRSGHTSSCDLQYT